MSDETKQWTDADIEAAILIMQTHGLLTAPHNELQNVKRLCRQIRDDKDERIAELEQLLTNARLMLSGEDAAWENFDELMFGEAIE